MSLINHIRVNISDYDPTASGVATDFSTLVLLRVDVGDVFSSGTVDAIQTNLLSMLRVDVGDD